MFYNKSWISYEDQADKLISRGLKADRAELIKTLQSVNYYRLTGYLYPFRKLNSDDFLPNTSLTEIWNRYRFDRRLRIIFLDAFERIEIAFRTQLVYVFSEGNGPFGYLKKANFPNINQKEFNKLKKDIQNEVDRCKNLTNKSKEDFVIHFFNKYGKNHQDLPMWMLSEIVSFGVTHTLLRGSDAKIIKEIAKHYNIPDNVLLSWIRAIHSLRNICAHHSRLCLRTLGYKPLLPKVNKYPQWHTPFNINQDRIFVMIIICKYLMDIIAPKSNWKNRLLELISEIPEVDLKLYGFPASWQDSEIWKK